VIRKLRTWSGALLFSLGAIGFLGGAVVALAGSGLPLGSVEFPLGDVQDIAVDRKGDILMALGFYGRIQVYDSRGHFQRGWSAEARGGGFTVFLRGPDTVASYAVRRGSTLLFDLAGMPLGESAEYPSVEHRTGARSTGAPDGSTLSVRRRFLWPTLVREKDGITSTLVTGPWYWRPVTGPVPTWLLMVAGTLLKLGRMPRISRRRLKTAV
jgi:hypothetical protein